LSEFIPFCGTEFIEAAFDRLRLTSTLLGVTAEFLTIAL